MRYAKTLCGELGVRAASSGRMCMSDRRLDVWCRGKRVHHAYLLTLALAISAVNSARSCSSLWPCYLTIGVEVGARALAKVDVTFFLPPCGSQQDAPRQPSQLWTDHDSLLHERPD